MFSLARAERESRLIRLQEWGEKNLSPEELSSGDAVSKLHNKALELFGCSTYTASNYAKVVELRLKGKANAR